MSVTSTSKLDARSTMVGALFAFAFVVLLGAGKMGACCFPRFEGQHLARAPRAQNISKTRVRIVLVDRDGAAAHRCNLFS